MFEPLSDRIREADFSCVNLETPLVLDGAYSDYPFFASPPEIAQAMAASGFDAATCATNHILDRGLRGIRDTKEIFDRLPEPVICLGINPAGTDPDTPYFTVVNRNGISAALLNVTYGTNGHAMPAEAPYCLLTLREEARVRAQLSASREAADLLIVFAHWGTEDDPEINEEQKKWTEIFLEEGVDLVIGTHPHVLQPVEMKVRPDGRQMLVYYSLGNMISAQKGKEHILGGLADVTFEKDAGGRIRIARYELLPLITHQEKGNYSAWIYDEYPGASVGDAPAP
jgi:poly-gamma-glutamate capsule biosynthesis protein CapA/YwtB (metallophosphatase superfamily)